MKRIIVSIFIASQVQCRRTVESVTEEKTDGFEHIQGILDQNQFKELSLLSENDRLERLEDIIKKIDIDENGELDESELEQWISYIEMRFVYEDTEKQLPIFDTDNDGKVSKDEIRETKYNPERIYNDPNKDLKTIETKKKQDFRRFEAADKNRDGKLNRDEFGAYLHPGSHEEMFEVTALETMEELDTDKDGYLDLDEYLGEMKHLEIEQQDEETNEVVLPMGDEDEDDEEEMKAAHAREYKIEWLQAERDAFNNVRDVNGDGYMDLAEVLLWQNPPDYSVVKAEAKYLIETADTDLSGTLNKTEVLASYDVFVQSSVTEWGASLLKHDEL